MKAKKKYTFRKLINDIHLWLGIASSLVLFVVCLTGTIYTFRTEIEQLIEPGKYKIEVVDAGQYAVEDMLQMVENNYDGKVQRVSFSGNAGKPIVFSVSGEKGKRGENVYVNPYTNEVVGKGNGPANEFFMTVFKLHRWLMLDMSVGRPIVGAATLIFVILSISGLILWFPKKVRSWKSLKSGFKIKFKANWKRVNHDLHNTLGFYSLLLIVIMSLTGLCWSFDWYRDGLGSVLGAKVFGGRGEAKPESAAEDGKTLDLSKVIKIAEDELPFQFRTMSISLPKDSKGSFEVNKNDKSRFNETVYDRIFIDQYSGEIIKKEIFADKTTGEKIAYSIRALHFGDIYGIFSKIIYFIVCLIATSLPITGILIWLNKMKKSKK